MTPQGGLFVRSAGSSREVLGISKRRLRQARALSRAYADVDFPHDRAKLFPNFHEQIVCIATKALHSTGLKVGANVSGIKLDQPYLGLFHNLLSVN